MTALEINTLNQEQETKDINLARTENRGRAYMLHSPRPDSSNFQQNPKSFRRETI